MFTCIQAVLVLYRMAPEASPALRTLAACAANQRKLREHMRLLVFDNGPETQSLLPLPFISEYISAPSNPGLAQAYNVALQRAEAVGCTWLLLLDQDTEVTANFLLEVLETTSNAALQSNVVVLVPRLVERDLVHSPTLLPKLSHPSVEQISDLFSAEVTAYNSGSVWRASAVTAMGGFPHDYPLDFLDHASFAQVQHKGGRVWLLRSVLRHTLSTAGEASTIRHARYRDMLLAERRFHRHYSTLSQRIWYRLRKVKQAAGRLRQPSGLPLAILELRAALGLLRH